MKTHKSKKILRLGVTCLSLLMITALLMVGGSFSKHTSTGDITGIPSLTVAGLDEDDIAVTVDSFGDKIDKDHVILCAVRIDNESDVPVTCGLDFWLHIDEISSLDSGILTDMDVLLYDYDNKEVSYNYNAVVFPDDNKRNIHVYTEDETIFVESESDATCAIVLDFKGYEMDATADKLYISPGEYGNSKNTNAVTLTVKQAAMEGT